MTPSQIIILVTALSNRYDISHITAKDTKAAALVERTRGGGTRDLMEGWAPVPKPAFSPCSVGGQQGGFRPAMNKHNKASKLTAELCRGPISIETQRSQDHKQVTVEFCLLSVFAISLFAYFISGNDLYQNRFNMTHPSNLMLLFKVIFRQI